MDDPYSPSLHGWNQPPGYGGQMFPGLGGDPFAGPPAYVNPTVIPPAQGAGKGGFNFAELKAMVDRMGGIDGVITTMGKFQKFMGIMSQMAPLLRVFMGKGSKAVAAGADTDSSLRRRRSNNANRTDSSKARSRRSGGRRR
jgi:hypothetical protein